MSQIEIPAGPAEVEERRWQAVMERDQRFDGTFVYAVKTTGVYCRPSCPSRVARRKNVAFFANCVAAEAAGYRPCKRCRPREESIAERNAKVVAEGCRMLETAEETPKLETVAAAVGMSPYYFHRVFKSVTGLTPKAYAAAHRSKRVREHLGARRGSVTEAIYDAGFNSNSRFYETSNSVLGMTPTAFRAGGAGADIKFAIGSARSARSSSHAARKAFAPS
jgi:AraC family transcriptional regulator of adaptative response/methylated-DNA-[protein]-cysteine methyltransferase